MTRYRFELAEPSDDPELRRLMADTPMPGDVTLAFEREPDFFFGNSVLGPNPQTIICRDAMHEKIVGVATRSSRMLFVDGEITRIGYLGGLRFANHVRGEGLLARGYRFLKHLHEVDDDPPAYYLTTIASSNETAKRILTSGRAGLPTYHRIGRLNTLLIPCKGRRSNGSNPARRSDGGFSFETLAQQESHGPWLDFLNRFGRHHNFFPAYREQDFGCDAETFRKLDFDSIMVVRRDSEIVATAGIWDQRTFRQTVVRGYSARMRIMRPLINGWSYLVGGLRLPKVGESVSAVPICLLAINDDSREVVQPLIAELLNRSNVDNLLVGLCDGNPLLDVFTVMSRLKYRTDIYAVNWKLDRSLFSGLRQSSIHLELGCL